MPGTLRPRLLRVCVALLVLMPLLAAQPVLAGTRTGHVVFRVTLQGPVSETDAFAIRCVSDTGEELCFETESGPGDRRTLCAPGPDSILPVCEADTYRRGARPPVGEQIDYALLRSTDGGDPVVVLFGSLIVGEATQDVSLTFVYSGGARPAPMLPNTSMAAP